MNRVLRIVNLFRVSNKKKEPHRALFFSCGELGIRTLDTLLGYTHFPGVLFRPLRQLSNLHFLNVAVPELRRRTTTQTTLHLRGYRKSANGY
jgi:hypothetical protein